MVRIILIPSPQGRQAWTVNGDGQGVEMELMEDGTTRFLRSLWSSSSRSCLASNCEEERPKLQTISGYARISGRRVIIQDGVIKQLIQRRQQPPAQTVLTVPKLETATTTTTSSFIASQPEAFEYQQHQCCAAGSLCETTESRFGEARLYCLGSPDGTVDGQPLLSGGLSMDELEGKSFMEMLREDADGDVMLGSEWSEAVTLMPQVRTEPDDTVQIEPKVAEASKSTAFAQDTTTQESGFNDAVSENGCASASDTINMPPSSTERLAEKSPMSSKLPVDEHNETLNESSGKVFTSAPRASDATVSKALKKRTVVLMDRWRTEEQAGTAAKNSTKSSDCVTITKKPRPNFVNPWAVMNSTETGLETAQTSSSSSWFSSRTTLDEINKKDSDFGTASKTIVTTSTAVTTNPAVAAKPATVTSLTANMDVSSNSELPAVAACVTIDTSVEATTTVPAATKKGLGPRLSLEASHTSRPAPARASSWHDDLEGAPKHTNRTRFLSLPTRLSDVALEEICGIVEEDVETVEEAEEVVDSDIVTAALGAESISQAEASPDTGITEDEGGGGGGGGGSSSSGMSTRSTEAELTSTDAAAPTVSLVASEELPSTPRTPLSPAPGSPFRAKQPSAGGTEKEKGGGGVRPVLAEDTHVSASWEILCEVPCADVGEGGKEHSWQASGASECAAGRVVSQSV